MVLAFNNLVTGNVANDYGLDDVPYTVGTTGLTTALVAFIGWDVAQQAYQSSAHAPAVNVTDSAGNLWRQIGISTMATSSRGAIWIADNPRQVEWVSVAVTGWANSTAYVIGELDGVPTTMQAVSIDFVNTTNSTAFTTSLSLSGSASTTDVLFGLLTTGGAGGALTVPTGWTGLTSVGGNTATDTTTYAMWVPSTVGSFSAFNPTWATSVPSSGIIVGLKQTATAPTQTNPNMPNVVIEAAFGAHPGDYTQSVDYTWDVEGITWTDISSRGFGKGDDANSTVKRGRQYELSQEETGEIEIELDNHDGALTWGNVGSEYYSNAVNQNMSFQSGLAPWTAKNAAVAAQSTVQVFASGYTNFATVTYSCQVTAGSSASPGISSEMIPVNPGFQYNASVWGFTTAGWSTGLQVGVNWYTSGEVFISSSFSSATPVPAGVWTQNSETVTPPSNAAFAVISGQLNGTPGSGFVFYLAEAALVQGSVVVRTGLVAPGVPIRVTAWWDGTQYPVAFGYTEKWPYEWPDMPQWGFVKVSAVDAYGPLASTDLPSAVIGEVRQAFPYAYFTTQEQYEFTSQSLTPTESPIDANSLIAVNYAFGNNRYGAYRDGYDQPVTTGQALNLLGDENTCLGATTYSGQEVEVDGPGFFYFDPNIPANSGGKAFSLEFWFVWGNTNTYSCQLFSAFGGPSSFTSPVPETSPQQGGVVSVGVNTGLNNASTVLSGFYVNGVELTDQQFNQTTFAPQHFVLTTSPAGTTTYLNGVTTATNPVLGTIPQIRAFCLGPARFSYDVSSMIVYNGYNYIAGHLAWYNYAVTPTQVSNHFEAGFNGWAGVVAPGRYAQALTWGNLGLKRGGTAWYGKYGNAEGTYMSEAYQYDGSSAADIMNQLTQTEGGRCFTQANGSLVYVYRWYLYNQPVVAVFGDNGTTEIPFEQDESFSVDNQFLYNVINAVQNRGPNQDLNVQNTNYNSQLSYFQRSGLQYQSYALLPFDVFDVTNWATQKYAAPQQRVVSVNIELSKIAGKFPNAFATVLGLELNQTVTVNRRPIGGQPFSVTGAIQSISHDVGPTYWHTTLQIAPLYPESSALFTDVSGQNSPNTQYLSW
jgi:hypothetical protein